MTPEQEAAILAAKTGEYNKMVDMVTTVFTTDSNPLPRASRKAVVSRMRVELDEAGFIAGLQAKGYSVKTMPNVLVVTVAQDA